MARSKVFTDIGKQVVFWNMAYVFLTTMVLLLEKSQNLSLSFSPLTHLAVTILFGLVQGLVFGICEQGLNNRFTRTQSLGVNILTRVLLYFLTTVGMLSGLRLIAERYLSDKLFTGQTITFNREIWRYIFYVIVLFNLVAAVVVSSLIQVSKKFGPGMLRPLITGKYRTPREESRVFLFMDLQSSTSLAEQLGHVRYSELIRDSFFDINLSVEKYHAQIYQYVGDQVVVSWLSDRLDDCNHSIEFFFDCQGRFKRRKSYYELKYGVCPTFRAGIHAGPVIAVEIGEIKREIAYHGDTINIASRLQGLCSTYSKNLIISSAILDTIKSSVYLISSIGDIRLKGKNAEVSVYSVNCIAGSII